MKGFSLCSIAAIAVLASPAFAEDSCTLGLQKLSDSKAAFITMATPVKEQAEKHIESAEEAQRMGDHQACGTHAEEALRLLEGPNKDGGGETE